MGWEGGWVGESRWVGEGEMGWGIWVWGGRWVGEWRWVWVEIGLSGKWVEREMADALWEGHTVEDWSAHRYTHRTDRHTKVETVYPPCSFSPFTQVTQNSIYA